MIGKWWNGKNGKNREFERGQQCPMMISSALVQHRGRISMGAGRKGVGWVQRLIRQVKEDDVEDDALHGAWRKGSVNLSKNFN